MNPSQIKKPFFDLNKGKDQLIEYLEQEFKRLCLISNVEETSENKNKFFNKFFIEFVLYVKGTIKGLRQTYNENKRPKIRMTLSNQIMKLIKVEKQFSELSYYQDAEVEITKVGLIINEGSS